MKIVIDGMYYINLRHRTDRMVSMERQSMKLKLDLIKQEAIYDYVNGADGLNKTICQMFAFFKLLEFSNVLIFEDDVIFDEKFKEKMQTCIDELPDDYDLLYFGLNPLAPLEEYSVNLLKVKMAYAAHAVLYSGKAFRKILDIVRENIGVTKLAYDEILAIYIQPMGNCYCSKEVLCKQSISKSDIFQYNPDKQIGIENYYNPDTQEINWQKMMDERFELLTRHLKTQP